MGCFWVDMRRASAEARLFSGYGVARAAQESEPMEPNVIPGAVTVEPTVSRPLPG